MTNYLKVDYENNSLVMDRTFAKSAQIAGSNEYRLLQEARSSYPTFKVTLRHIKKNSAKECYKGLTYAYMEDYIRTHESLKTVNAVLHEFEEMLLVSKCHSQAFRYPTIKKWFLEKYPEIAKFGMPKVDEIMNEVVEEVNEEILVPALSVA